MGFAVPIDTVKEVVPQLKADGEIDRAWLGVSTSDAAPRDGALVREVTGEPAQRGGLRPGDLIVSFDGSSIATASDLGQAVLTRKPGDTVEVVVQRDGEPRDPRASRSAPARTKQLPGMTATTEETRRDVLTSGACARSTTKRSGASAAPPARPTTRWRPRCSRSSA